MGLKLIDAVELGKLRGWIKGWLRNQRLICGRFLESVLILGIEKNHAGGLKQVAAESHWLDWLLRFLDAHNFITKNHHLQEDWVSFCEEHAGNEAKGGKFSAYLHGDPG